MAVLFSSHSSGYNFKFSIPQWVVTCKNVWNRGGGLVAMYVDGCDIFKFYLVWKKIKELDSIVLSWCCLLSNIMT